MMPRWLGRLKAKSGAFEEWQRQNPSKPFKEFFAESVGSKLARGKAHASLGGKLLQGGTFGHTGQRAFKRLAAYGLTANDACVDYGCGTLRMGIHAINYLGPGLYWGLDISDLLLKEGRALIGEGLWQEKRPHLRVISPESVEEVAAVKPAMLLSLKVLIHVHPDELPEYIRNIMTIIGTWGQALVTGKWSDEDTVQTGALSWLHAAPRIRDLVGANGGYVEILKERNYESDGNDKPAKYGMLRFAPVSRVPREAGDSSGVWQHLPAEGQ
jgi:hypothetical protein